MRVIDHLCFPDLRRADRDAQLFMQLPAQGLLDRLTRFEFATRKFPIACVDLALRARSQQKLPIGLQQYPDRHIDHGTFGLARAQGFALAIAVGHQQTCTHAAPDSRPIMSRANW